MVEAKVKERDRETSREKKIESKRVCVWVCVRERD